VVAVEAAVQRRAAVAGSAESDSLSGVLGVGGVFFVGCQYFVHLGGGFLFWPRTRECPWHCPNASPSLSPAEKQPVISGTALCTI